ncbi:EAL domain-containing protein [Microvirga sp. GCM10011540]|uniref:bifunctional diguanylate cyclase/phosphodiesterase n=1 Tax=Microvirga sp. GCM10011540 TaxID=3317338 RepID=UPI00360B254F
MLDTEPETAFNDIVNLASRICDAPLAAISLLDERRQWFKAGIGLDVRETTLDISFCTHTIRQTGVFIVPDATEDARFCSNPLVTMKPHIRLYAGTPLVSEEGLPLGTLCIADTEARPDGLTELQSAALLTLARAAVRELELRQTSRILTQRGKAFETVVDALPQMAWAASANGRFEYRNKHYYEFIGVPPDSTEWSSVAHPDDQERVLVRWNRCLSTGEPYQAEYRLRHHSGEYRWILARAHPIRDRHGNIERWIGTSTDIHAVKTAEATLAREEERHRALLEASSVVLWVATPDGMITETKGWQEVTGQEKSDYVGLGSVDTLHPDDRVRIEQAWLKAVSAGVPYEAECRVRQAGGEYRWMQTRAVPVRNPDGTIREWVGGLSDIHDRKDAEEQLRASEKRLRLAMQAGRMVAWEQDLAAEYVTRSENSIDVLGIGSGPPQEFLERVHPEDLPARDQLLAEIAEKGTETSEFRYILPDGRTLWLATRGERVGTDRIVGVTFDITDRKAAEEEVWRVANHDPLTGLPNRVLFQRRLEQALTRAKQNGTCVGLLMIDLDDFKDVNDTLGHGAGDALLVETANRLVPMMRECDMVARLGGDEFAVLVTDPLKLHNTVSLAEIIIKRFRQPFAYEGRTISGQASIGVAAFPDHDDEPAELMKDADIALYRAKAEGRNRVVTYSPEMRAMTEQRLAIGREMRSAISQDQIIPVYQPKVCLKTGRIVGFEALARWDHPTRGLLTPGTFGVAFDDPELAKTIGKRLIGKVASDILKWLSAGFDPGRVAVNLSSAEFSQPDMADEVLHILALAKIPTKHFEVEVTERVLLESRFGMVSDALTQFHRQGVQIALDDFGTGYASLAHLKQFPVDHIKIDQSFVSGLEQNGDDAAIVAAVIGLSGSLNLQVTAEGVETEGQARRLREMGCNNAQGYLFAKPVFGAEVAKLLAGWDPGRLSAMGIR